MSFKTDNGGVALSLKDVKISTSHSGSTWNTRLSQIANSKGELIICTYSLPNPEYITRILDKRSNVILICHEKFRDRVMALKNKYPDLTVHLKKDVHAKMVLLAPHTVWLSSANFGASGWFEQTIGIHDARAYQFYREQIERYLDII